MSDTTIKKIASAYSPVGEDGQIYLASGVGVSMRMWRNEEPTEDKEEHSNPYETVGYVISGRARLEIGDQTVTLEEGDSWLVPRNAKHRYVIETPFTAIEATAPPAQVHGRED